MYQQSSLSQRAELLMMKSLMLNKKMVGINLAQKCIT